MHAVPEKVVNPAGAPPTVNVIACPALPQPSAKPNEVYGDAVAVPQAAPPTNAAIVFGPGLPPCSVPPTFIGVTAAVGVTALDAADSAPLPTLFVACTVNVYAVPFVNPVTLTLVAPAPAAV